MMIVHLIFWIWYSIGAVLLLFFGVPESLNFSNGLFLVFYGLYALLLSRKAYLSSDDISSLTTNRRRNDRMLWVAAAGIWLGGMGVEWIGVHSGWPFGVYHYSDILGFGVYEVPVTMGFAWIAVVCNAVLIGKNSSDWQGRLIRALKVGFWTVVLDLCLDPVAFDRNFWAWEGEGGFYGVPLDNYISWFIIGALLSLLLPNLQNNRRISRQGTFLYQMILLLFGSMGFQGGLTGSGIAAAVGILLAEGSYRYAYRHQIKVV